MDLPRLELLWEKTTLSPGEGLGGPSESLRIVGEELLRFWCLSRGTKSVLPLPEESTSYVRESCFIALRVWQHQREVRKENYHLVRDVMLARITNPEAAVPPDLLSYVNWNLYKWQKMLTPGIPPPADPQDELMQQMEKYREFFESGQGLQIQAR